MPRRPSPASGAAETPPSYIVGLGGSAGSFDAFRRIMEGLDAQTGMAFVFVLHLPPDKESLVTEIVQRWTGMPVYEAADGLRLQADCVYVIPPDHDLFVARGRFHAKRPRTKNLRHHQVDIFLKSLAVAAGRRAIAVILSGGDGDGAEGLAAVKFHGGVTFAQDGSARVESMPLNAQATGCVDNVLAPSQIAAELNAIARAERRAVRHAG